VGSGLYGATFAQVVKQHGKTCLVIDKREHIAGNCYTKKEHGIDVHCYGPHLWNTNSEEVWQYVQRFSKFTQYAHRVKVNYHNRIYSMPINLQTMYEIYGVRTPEEARRKIEEVRVPIVNPQNLEDWCLSQVGPDLYNIFIKHYTEKQWDRSARELPTSIIKRLPIRLNFDDRWHQSIYSGIPVDGYTALVANMLDGIQVELGTDYFAKDWTKYAKQIVYSGPIDALFNYCHGELEYRTLRFESKTLDGDYQGIGQVNYTDAETPFTRIVEHKHFNLKPNDKTIVTWEYPEKWNRGAEPYYPINDEKNDSIYKKYKKELDNHPHIVVGGRLGSYLYKNMDQILASALHDSKKYLS
jgi:UDP-galactopyranose mutase